MLGMVLPMRMGTLPLTPRLASDLFPRLVRVAAAPSTAAGKGVGKNGAPVTALHLMNETLVHHALSRNGPVNLEISAALTRVNIGRDVMRIWQRLDEFVTTHENEECDRIIAEALAIADRLYNAQVGLAEAVLRREWNEEWARLLSCVIPGTRSGGLSGCRFEHTAYG